MIFLSILRLDSNLAQAILDRWAAHIPAELATHRRAARALLHEMLTTELGLRPAQYRLNHEKNGRPVLAGDNDTHLPIISLTHSGGWIACVAETTPGSTIGLDLERTKAGRDHLALAAAAFGPEEVAAVQRGGSDTFYRIWTAREAWAKASGLGLAGAADRQDRVPPALLEESASDAMDEHRCRWLVAQPLPDLYLALVSRVSSDENHSTLRIRKCHVSSELTLNTPFFSASPSNETNTQDRTR